MNCTPQQEQAITAQLLDLGFRDEGAIDGGRLHALVGMFPDMFGIVTKVGFREGFCFLSAMCPDPPMTVPMIVNTPSTFAVLRTIMGVLL